MNLRGAVALEQGLDERMVGQVAAFAASDLPERQKVALRFVERFLTDPATIDEDLRANLARHFHPAELIELTLFVIASRLGSKTYVAIGAEPEVMPVTTYRQ
jgi:alkylhydroperoxidase family enzyme